jgi:hypothetical protein
MRVTVWRVRGTDHKREPEHPAWRDLEAHTRELEAVARAIRHDVARRNTGPANVALGQMMRRSQHARDRLGMLMAEPRPPVVKT